MTLSEMQIHDWVECEFCHEVQPVEDAIDAGWVPEFYKAGIPFGPACPRCAERFLKIDDSGEYVLR